MAFSAVIVIYWCLEDITPRKPSGSIIPLNWGGTHENYLSVWAGREMERCLSFIPLLCSNFFKSGSGA